MTLEVRARQELPSPSFTSLTFDPGVGGTTHLQQQVSTEPLVTLTALEAGGAEDPGQVQAPDKHGVSGTPVVTGGTLRFDGISMTTALGRRFLHYDRESSGGNKRFSDLGSLDVAPPRRSEFPQTSPRQWE